MKKTSIFFLIISAVLIIAGFVVRGIAINKAENANVKLFRQDHTKDGDLIETIDFSSADTNKINIQLSDVDINIIGNSEKSYAEIINLNSLEYSAFTNNRAFTIQNDIISSIVGRAEGGNINFNGLRDYIRLGTHGNNKVVNIYLSSNAAVKIIDIKIKNGNVNVDGVNRICDYVISINKGNIVYKNTDEISLLNANINDGNISIDNSYIANTDINIKNGNLDFSTLSYLAYSYDVECKVGKISYNSENYTGTFNLQNEGKKSIFKAQVGVGDVIIKTIEHNFE